MAAKVTSVQNRILLVAQLVRLRDQARAKFALQPDVAAELVATLTAAIKAGERAIPRPTDG